MPEGKRKRLETDVDGTQIAEAENPNKPMPYTNICYDGALYITDEEGHFMHKMEQGIRIMRCEQTPERNVVFTFIRNLSDAEVEYIQHVNDTFPSRPFPGS